MAQLKMYQGKMILLFNRQELLIAEMYRFFASLFPETREFWTDLCREELEHAEWVEYLYKKTQTDSVIFYEKKLRSYTVESFVKYLEDNLAKVKDKAPTLEAAFSLALNIENSLLVQRVFDHFQSSDEGTSILLRRLQSRMKDHRKHVEEQAARYLSPVAAGS
jgi:rubrerythrin